MTDELPGVDIELPPEEQEAPKEDAKPEEGSDLAPDTPEGEEKDAGQDGKQDESGQDKVQQAINKQHRKYREEERAHQETQRELEAARQELAKARGQDVEPEIPPLPDQYDEDYQEKIQAREAALTAHAEWKGRQSAYAEQEANQQREAHFAAQQELATMADGYAKRAKELGVNGESLQKASEVVTQYGVPDDLVRLLLQDEDGPLMTQYLATDIPMLDKLARMPAMQVGQFIEREVRPKADGLRPQSSDAPAPPETLGGAGPGADILGPHKGVTIE